MTLTDIMNQGYDSFFDGLPIEYNPYSINTPEYRVWVTGYEDAKYGSFKK